MPKPSPDVVKAALREEAAWIMVSTDALLYLGRLIDGEDLADLMKESSEKKSLGGKLALHHVHRRLDAL